MWWGAGVEGLLSAQWGKEFALLEREEVTMEREEGREREEVKGRQGRTEALGVQVGRGNRHAMSMPLAGLMERKLGWRAWEQLLHSAGSTQTPVSTSPASFSALSSLSRVLVLSQTPALGSVSSAPSLSFAACSSSFLPPPLET